MPKRNLHEFKGKDTVTKLKEAADYLREHPGSTLVIDPGEYIISTEKARAAQAAVMNGEYGAIPQLVMFRPDYDYDRALDLDQTKNCRIEAYGVTFIIDGFLELLSVRNCKGAEILGLTVDHKRRPYSRGTVTEVKDGRIFIELHKDYPVSAKTPCPRAALADEELKRFTKDIALTDMEYTDEYHVSFKSNFTDDVIGKRVYLWHTFHSRPAILLENAEKVHLRDITVKSYPGMGLTAHDSKDILIERLKVVPAEGEFMSTNTDATHFASCRGKLKLDGCMFVGMGDDGINCHSYYHNILEINGNTIKTKANPTDGTHTQVPDTFKNGDTLEIVCADTLDCTDNLKIIKTETDRDGVCTSVLDKEPDISDTDKYFICDRNSLPELTLVNCTMKNHYARGALIKTKIAKVENCTIENTFDYAIKLSPESSWRESGAFENITVKGCRMTGCGSREGICGGVFAYSESNNRNAAPNGKVVIENCEINCPDAANAIIIRNTKSATVRNNKLKSQDKTVILGR